MRIEVSIRESSFDDFASKADSRDAIVLRKIISDAYPDALVSVEKNGQCLLNDSSLHDVVMTERMLGMIRQLEHALIVQAAITEKAIAGTLMQPISDDEMEQAELGLLGKIGVNVGLTVLESSRVLREQIKSLLGSEYKTL